MGWLQRLIETYDACCGADQFAQDPLPPIGHTQQQAHIEIVLDNAGNFKRAQIVRKEETLIPATETSAGRTGKAPPPHPLCDKIQYVAGDYVKHSGKKPSFYIEYLRELSGWCNSSYSHIKAKAVLSYVQRETVVADLVKAKILHTDLSNRLLTKWEGSEEKPEIFRLIVATDGEQDQGGAFVRWLVESPGDLEPAVWRDAQLQNAWVQYNASKMLRTGLCMATGANDVALASSHPKRLRHAGDGAKLISSNDSAGFTFRGRFTDNTGDQACEIGFEASQKAHLALRWLIKRQAYKHADQAIVAWAVRGEDIPDPLADTLALFGIDSTEENEDYRGDSGQSYSLALKRMISGYRSKLTQNNTVIVMGLDAATPGRMAVTFYREFDGSEFLDRIESWHGHYAWHQNFGKEARFVGAASPRDIAQATYGTKVDDRLRKSTVERLLPCIVDARPVPRDILDSTVRRAAQRVGMEHWEWEKTLGIACGLYRGFHIERNYQMALEQDRTSRDYLYGRLLAIADRMESLALYMAKENRDTTAARLTHRFSDHPYSTWRTIEMALQPYKSRLRSSGGGSLNFYEKQIDAVCSLFEPEDFTSDRRLGGEFLLGYHCQRAKFYEAKPTDQEPKDDSQEDQ